MQSTPLQMFCLQVPLLPTMVWSLCNTGRADVSEGMLRCGCRRLVILSHVQVAAGAILGLLVGLFYPTPITAFT